MAGWFTGGTEHYIEPAGEGERQTKGGGREGEMGEGGEGGSKGGGRVRIIEDKMIDPLQKNTK